MQGIREALNWVDGDHAKQLRDFPKTITDPHGDCIKRCAASAGRSSQGIGFFLPKLFRKTAAIRELQGIEFELITLRVESYT
jgi:hypothetical protein